MSDNRMADLLPCPICGECKNIHAGTGFKCSKCGYEQHSWSNGTTVPIMPSFCPNCGRKVDYRAKAHDQMRDNQR